MSQSLLQVTRRNASRPSIVFIRQVRSCSPPLVHSLLRNRRECSSLLERQPGLKMGRRKQGTKPKTAEKENVAPPPPATAPQPDTSSTPAPALATPLHRDDPLKHKPPASARLPGIKITLPSNLSIPRIKTRLRERLGLSYTPDDWQAHTIRRILQGYDSVVVAGTGYGKSLIFEGLAVLGGYRKVVLVISPLKALERDQAKQASEKGIEAVVINEDTTKTASLWDQARRTAALVYISPEMALSESFAKLWKDAKFRSRLTAVVVDEAHCVDEWGTDDFRPDYSKLSALRHFTGRDIPFLACTATASTSTFDSLWSTLKFGSRPFWGIDVGVDRPNLLFQVRGLANPTSPLIDILNFLPSEITAETKPADLPKCLLYFNTEDECRQAVAFLRKLMPTKELRKSVHAFSSNLSEKYKVNAWEAFESGKLRILCATDAAGMGCNVKDVRYVISFGIPKSVSQVFQRWGRAGRDRKTEAVCLLLVPPWALRPDPSVGSLVLAPARDKAEQKAREKAEKARQKQEQKDAEKRDALPVDVERLINLKYEPSHCIHGYVRHTFRPKTRLHTFFSLDALSPTHSGDRSRSSRYELSWTVIDVARNPPPSRCCHLCNPTQLLPFAASDSRDPRLSAHADKFLYPLANLDDEQPKTVPKPTTWTACVLPEDVDDLESRLIAWRKAQHSAAGSPSLLSPSIFLPSKQLKALCSEAKRIASESTITPAFIQKVVPLQILSDVELKSLVTTLSEWKKDIDTLEQPPPSKRARHDEHSSSPTPAARQPLSTLPSKYFEPGSAVWLRRRSGSPSSCPSTHHTITTTGCASTPSSSTGILPSAGGSAAEQQPLSSLQPWELLPPAYRTLSCFRSRSLVDVNNVS
ncbi:hypothetical protein NMY22_g3064 [Coprinellus aureogranulatus]|nr:hypothetical protein NMY22_g3064 [Coprinellus aureogranulatus]